MQDNQEFGTTAFQTAASIAFPRLVGSAGEREARKRIAKAFEEAGLDVREEQFNCSDFAIRVAARWAVVPTGALILIAALLLNAGLNAPAIICAALSILPAAWISSRAQAGFHRPDRKIQHRTANVIGEIPAKQKQERIIILMAHYDSKSQNFPIWLRILLFVITGLGSILMMMLIIACAIADTIAGCPLTGALVIAAIILFALCLSFLLNRVGNRSDGALDNATGVGIITELAAILKNDPLPDARVIVIAAAAEEIGLCGSNAFLDEHEDELDRGKTVVLNFDGCGGGLDVGVLAAYGVPRKKIRPDLLVMTRDAAKDAGALLSERYIPIGMATDLMPFRKRGFDGIDFIGMATQSHTTKDRMNLVSESAIADFVTTAHGLIRRISGQGIK